MGHQRSSEQASAAPASTGQPNIQFKDEGVNKGTSGGITAVDFVGAGVTASDSGATLTVTIGAGAADGLGPDGDKGDVTVGGTGTTLTIDNNAVTFAKMQDIATDRLLGRDTAASGDVEELTVGGGVEFTGTGIQRSALTGDVTATAGSNATTIANDAVTYAKMQNVSAASKLLGRGSAGGAGDVEEITLGTNLTMTGTTLDAAGGGGTAASQAEEEAGSSTTVFTSPGRQHFHPAAAKFWVYWTGNSTTVLASYNTTSIADTAVGDADVTIGTDFSSANWAGFVCTNDSTANGWDANSIQSCGFNARAAGTCGVLCGLMIDGATAVGNLIDPEQWQVLGFGDQA